MRLMGSVLALSVATFLVATARAQNNPPLFSAEATMVRLNMSVRSALPRPLTEADIAVYDNGQKQTVTFFGERMLGMDMFLLLDTSNSMSEVVESSGISRLRPGVPESAKQFINILKPDDRMEVVSFSSVAETVQELTGDREALTATIDRIDAARGKTMLMVALYDKLKQLKRLKKGPEQERRRVLVVITDALDNGIAISENDLRDLARQAGASVYMLLLDPQPNARKTLSEKDVRWLLNRICEESGGAILPSRTTIELARAARIMSAELATEYTIGWIPETVPAKDPWHTVQLAVRGVSSDRLRYRSGYLNR